MSEHPSVEERLAEAQRESYRTGERVRVVAWTDDEARWLSEQFGRNILRGDYVEFRVEVSDV